MRIYEVIQEANRFQDRADAIAKSKALAGDYRSNRIGDLRDLIKQKQKADAKTQSWRDMRQSSDMDSPSSKTYGTGRQNRQRVSPTTTQRSKMQTYAGIKSRPASVEPDSSSGPLNTGVRELFNQGMSPSEIEDYLVFQKKIKRNLARKIIDQELYQPASTPKQFTKMGGSVTGMALRKHKRKQQQNNDSDDEEDK